MATSFVAIKCVYFILVKKNGSFFVRLSLAKERYFVKFLTTDNAAAVVNFAYFGLIFAVLVHHLSPEKPDFSYFKASISLKYLLQ